MTRLTKLLLPTILAALPCLTLAQALIPEGHPGFVLADAIAARGCVLHQDDVNAVMEEAGLPSQHFPMMAVPLMQDGYLAPGEEGTLVLSNWGLCTLGSINAPDPEESGSVPEDEAGVVAE